jgi:hypothetical protein
MVTSRSWYSEKTDVTYATPTFAFFGRHEEGWMAKNANVAAQQE